MFRRLEVIAAQVASTPHVEFHLRWATEILQNHASWLQVSLFAPNRRNTKLVLMKCDRILAGGRRAAVACAAFKRVYLIRWASSAV
jgi:hypothetical protein